MAALNSICVFCGSASGGDPVFAEAARQLGSILAAENIGLVYGGGGRGLMGTLAHAVLDGGGRVTGIIPDFLTDGDAILAEVTGRRVEHIVVPDMHSRKRLMFERADAFVALPGGIGTLEELVEQMTWVQLARHTKPVLIADIGGFWRPLLALFAHMREHGFIYASADVRTLTAERIEDVLPRLRLALAEVPDPRPPVDDRL